MVSKMPAYLSNLIPGDSLSHCAPATLASPIPQNSVSRISQVSNLTTLTPLGDSKTSVLAGHLALVLLGPVRNSCQC
jgi:hypothetical protein